MLKSSIALPWTALLCAAVVLLSACGQKVLGPPAITMHERHWFQIFGDKIKPGEDAREDRLLTRGDQYVGLSEWNLLQTVQLHLAIPDQIVSPAILRTYTKKTGVGFRISIFSSEAEFHQLLGKGSVDVALVPMQLAEELVQRNLLERLAHAALPRLKDLEWPKPVFKYFTRDLPIDRDNKYLVPYLFGSIGIAYDRTYLPSGVPSFKMLHHPELLDPEELTNVIGRVALSNDRRTVLAGTLLSIGEDINTTNTAAIERAAKQLLQLRPYLYKHGGTNSATADRLEWARRMARHEIVMAEATSANAALAATLNPEIDFLVPTEGGILFLDSFVIPRGGKTLPAHQFINFMLDPVVAGTFAGLSNHASTSQQAKAFVPREVLRGPAYKLQWEPLLLRAGNWDLKKLELEVFDQLLEL
jgi:spermidine/putrescine transport system substrate-binding protein